MAIWAAYVQKYHAFLSDQWMAETRKLMCSTYLQASDTHVYEYNEQIVGFIAMVETYIGVLFVESEHERCSFYERHGFVFVTKELHDISGEYLTYYHLPKNSSI